MISGAQIVQVAAAKKVGKNPSKQASPSHHLSWILTVVTLQNRFPQVPYFSTHASNDNVC
jgi:hypothetical protein